jgi:hypothetical protein
MAHIAIISEQAATGSLKEDYEYIANSYSNAFETQVSAPQVYTASSLIDEYFHFGAVQNSVLTNHGQHDLRQPGLPNILVNFGVSLASGCFY